MFGVFAWHAGCLIREQARCDGGPRGVAAQEVFRPWNAG